jgi:hypothetical protein
MIAFLIMTEVKPGKNMAAWKQQKDGHSCLLTPFPLLLLLLLLLLLYWGDIVTFTKVLIVYHT